MRIDRAADAEVDDALDQRDDEHIERTHKKGFSLVEYVSDRLGGGVAVACPVGGGDAYSVVFRVLRNVIKFYVACGSRVGIYLFGVRCGVLCNVGRLRLGCRFALLHVRGFVTDGRRFFLRGNFVIRLLGFVPCIIVQAGEQVFIIALRGRAVGIEQFR